MGIDLLDLQVDKGGNPELVRESQRRRNASVELVDEVMELYDKWVKVVFQRSQRQKEVNAVQKQIGDVMKPPPKPKAGEPAPPPRDQAALLAKKTALLAQKAEIEAGIVDLANEAKEAEALLNKKAGTIGNIVHDSVPISTDEADNRVERTHKPHGEPLKNQTLGQAKRAAAGTAASAVAAVTDAVAALTTEVSQEDLADDEAILSHHEVMYRLDMLEMERGAKVAGHRGYFLTNDGIDLNQALIAYGLDFLRGKGYKKIQPPFFMNKSVMAKTAQLEEFDEALYKIEGEGADNEKYLIATSEQPISALHSDELFDQPDVQLPIRYAGYSTCFRKEAGSSGRDVLGIFRVHQFEKIEQFCITDPSSSWDEFHAMIAKSEEFYQSLGLPYQLVSIVSGALNNAAAKKYDLEAWFPFHGEWKELVSVSNCTDYQSRALEVRCGVKQQGATKKVYVHMLNGTLCATERALCCLVENYQTKNGINVPPPLQKYMQGRTFLPYTRELPTAQRKR